MESISQKWSLATQKIYQGVLFYALGGIIYDVFDTINNWGSMASNVMNLMERGTIDTKIGFLDVVCWLILLGIIYGYYLYLTGLRDFKPLQKGADVSAVGKIYTAVILAIIGIVCDFIPFLGWVGSILSLIAFIMMLIAFSALKNSTTFPHIAKVGAGKLHTAMILTIVAIVVGIIPLVGWLFELVLDIISFFLILKGWSLIKDSRPEEETTVIDIVIEE